jgi:integrase
LVDALASGASIGNDVEVRVLSWAPRLQDFTFINQCISYRYATQIEVFTTQILSFCYTWQMKVTLKNYIKASPKTGRLSYRRRIPEKLKQHFKKDDGSLRGLEWNEALGTKSITVALKKAVEVNERFERTKALAKQLNLASNAKDETTKQELAARVVDHFIKLGIHPDQAPNIFQPSSVINAFHNRSEEVLQELLDYQLEAGLDVVDGEFGDVTYVPNKVYEDIQAQIDFLRGDCSGIKNRLKPTWEGAVEEYIYQKESAENFPTGFRDSKKIKRIIRIATDFARSLGRGSVNAGNEYLVSEVSREDARRFTRQKFEQGKTPATIGRELVPLSAIYVKAQREFGKRDPDLNINGNPFSGLRGELEEQDENAVRKGLRTKKSARAWSYKELNQLSNLLSRMNEEAHLCMKLAIYTGARLHDVCGILIDDISLEGEEDSLLHIRHNVWRTVSKDSIERKIPLYGEMLQHLKQYVAVRDFTLNQKLTPRYAKNENSAESLSNLVNQRYIDRYISKDSRLRPHGLRNTMQARFDATNTPNKLSGYLIGWKDQQTVGMQKEYNKQGYPHSQLLQALRACHAATEWAV